MDRHREEVERIAVEVQTFYNSKEKFRIYHGATNSTRRPVDASTKVIDTSALNHVLDIDVLRKIATVEANVPMDALLEATLQLDVMPLMVIECPGITVGGAFSGTAGESSSFKHYFFDQTVAKVEMVLGNGEVVECSKDENKEIFDGAPGALGTFGVVTLLQIRLQPAVRFVELTYHPFSSIDEAIDLFRRFPKEDKEIEYLEGLMFSPTKGAVITGKFRLDASSGLPVQRLIRAKDPWYYIHVESRISGDSKEPQSDLIPVPDYLFRYSRGAFWCGKSMFDVTGVPFTKTTRRMFDFMLRTRMLYKALHAQNPGTLMLVQDLALPYQGAIDFVKWEASRFGIWPLLLCPLRASPMPTLHPHPQGATPENVIEPDMLMNIGLYGTSPTSPQNYPDWIAANKEIECQVRECRGMKWAYAAQLYAEDVFWEQHDRAWYEGLRERCHATALPDIYQKTRVNYEKGMEVIVEDEERWKGGVRGRMVRFKDAKMTGRIVWEMLKSRAWREERHRAWKDWPVD